MEFIADDYVLRWQDLYDFIVAGLNLNRALDKCKVEFRVVGVALHIETGSGHLHLHILRCLDIERAGPVFVNVKIGFSVEPDGAVFLTEIRCHL